ncbi:phospholipase carboxylesterase family protein [Stylonychia lemnae]|uniref:Phospholipase carboxylesterase family protein n=1 Tax=Stylonychia lemnae TaxID=5949 RepID=A0A078B0W1_STYLE|nr:phospholipase carboxylesterase family protein [Stylonychia lemnae]|eukprot:CDW88194.1 phospholipase carboxylesterase family protein [Stylonychia lemnae]
MAESGEYYLKKIKNGTLPVLDSFRIILPTADNQFVNRIQKECISWYNVEDMDPEEPKRYNEPEMLASMNFLKGLISKEAETYYQNDYSKVFLAGFSQGCCLSFLIGLTFNHILGGVIGFGGIVVPLFFKMIKGEDGDSDMSESFLLRQKAESLPVLQYHGKNDPLFQLDRVQGNVERSWTQLGFQNYQIISEEGLPHYTSETGFKKMNEFIQEIVQKQGKQAKL